MIYGFFFTSQKLSISTGGVDFYIHCVLYKKAVLCALEN